MATSAESTSSSFSGLKMPVRMTELEFKGFLGNGSFGQVLKAFHAKSGRTVAVKRMAMLKQKQGDSWLPKDVEREIANLSKCQHENIVEFIAIVIPEEGDHYASIMLEHMNTDLRTALQNRTQPLSLFIINHWMIHLLKGLEHIHSKNLIHRDLKPGNLLLNQSGTLKIADFGLSRPALDPSHGHTAPLTPLVGTVRYMSPEVLLRSTFYTQAADIWAVGCIFAEMLSGQCLFKGMSEIHQLVTIFNIMGTPRSRDWPQFKQLTNNYSFPPAPKKNLMLLLSSSHLYRQHAAEHSAMELLADMLHYNPSRRVNSKQALCHSWFKETK